MTRAINALTVDLNDLPLEPGSVVSGTPRAGLVTSGALGEVEVGVWELTEGTVTDTEADELFVVLSGTGTVTFADGESIDLAPGVLVRLHEGEQTTWTITSPLRKVWIS
ncbi:cupin domain-containing protein [Nocardioides sp.]|uniref:cupin domain-containing protein n=1 Tax=Nocardioides sp. TaxID=35761 RepID=UPI002626F06D|nr:cupin domain-containing protein [Nocardioides sp.]